MFTTTAFAQAAGATGSDFQSQLMGFLPIVLIMGVFYFLLFRPQQQKAKQLKQAQGGLRRGDRVITAGGIIGSVSRVINDDEIEIQIAEAVRVRVVRSTVSAVLAKTEPAGKTVAAKADDDKETGDDDVPAAPPTTSAARRRRTPPAK